jgi:hypothetical protein
MSVFICFCVFALYIIVFVFFDEAEACCPRTGVSGDGRTNLEGRQEFHAGNRFLQQSVKAVHIVPNGICAGHCDIMCGIFAGFLEMLCGDGCNLCKAFFSGTADTACADFAAL